MLKAIRKMFGRAKGGRPAGRAGKGGSAVVHGHGVAIGGYGGDVIDERGRVIERGKPGQVVIKDKQ